jgi:hypothetical protein
MNGNKPYLAATRGTAGEEGHARTIGAEQCPSNSRPSGSFDPNHAPALCGNTASGVQRNPRILGCVARTTQEVSAVPYLPRNCRKTSWNVMRSLREESQSSGKSGARGNLNRQLRHGGKRGDAAGSHKRLREKESLLAPVTGFFLPLILKPPRESWLVERRRAYDFLDGRFARLIAPPRPGVTPWTTIWRGLRDPDDHTASRTVPHTHPRWLSPAMPSTALTDRVTSSVIQSLLIRWEYHVENFFDMVRDMKILLKISEISRRSEPQMVHGRQL